VQCEKFRQGFLNSHAKHSLFKLKDISHTIIYLRGTLSLLQKTLDNRFHEIQSVDTAAKEPTYIVLKSLAHCSVWLDILVDSLIHGDQNHYQFGEESRDLYDQLQMFKQSTHPEIRAYLPFIKTTMDTIDTIRSASDMKDVTQLYRGHLLQVEDDIKVLGIITTRLQINSLDKIMKDWSSKYKIALRNSRIIISGTQGPREEMIEKEYFKRIFAKIGIYRAEEEKRMVLYAESLIQHIPLIEHQDLIQFLCTNEINKRIGHSMLGDAKAMNKDILGKYASTVLDSLESNKEISEKIQENKSRCPYGFS